MACSNKCDCFGLPFLLYVDKLCKGTSRIASLEWPEKVEIAMGGVNFTIFLVGHGCRLVATLNATLSRAGYITKIYPLSKSFLSEHDPSVPGCAILSLSMDDLSGLDVQQALARQEIARPVVFLTDHVTVPVTVLAMRAGAIDVLLEPIERSQLLESIRRAQQQDEMNRRVQAERETIIELAQKLSPREREVLIHVIAGLRNKEIAEILGVGVKTIKVHRGRAMKKMEVASLAELVRIAAKVPLQPESISQGLIS